MILRILDALETMYHNEENPPNLKHDDPLDGLILTVLSQNTNDKNRDRAFENLKANFPTWETVDPSRLEDVIRVAGLAHTKSARIIEILERVHRDFGECSLKGLLTPLSHCVGHPPLTGGTREILASPVKGRCPTSVGRRGNFSVREYLRALPGVGPKTAACVLLFEFGLKAFPVDTHITRIARRTGIARPKASPEEISEIFESVVPAERCLGGHVNLIQHGRAVCRSQKPLCEKCILKRRSCCENFV